jgi:hypothetical protein
MSDKDISEMSINRTKKIIINLIKMRSIVVSNKVEKRVFNKKIRLIENEISKILNLLILTA